MKFDTLVSLVGDLEWFDFATLVQLTGERRATITMQLSRMIAAGKIVSLRRGMYALAPHYRRVPIQPAALANALYRPSYLSEAWALSFHGVIPESAAVYTSVTSRLPAHFENDCGSFSFRHVKQDLFFGYQRATLSGRAVLIASPDKALLDFFHLSRGEWTDERIVEMRFSPGSGIDPVRFQRLAARVGGPRLQRAAAAWARVVARASHGDVEL